MAGDRERRDAGERAYFRLPAQGWERVGPAVEGRLRELRQHLDAALDADRRSAEGPTPAELALDLGGVATALFERLSPEERDLREVITTMRTALALCWDMYSYQEAGRVSVQAHMDRLKSEIEGFQAELQVVQSEQEGQGKD